MFTLAEARQLIATLRPRIDELITLRADLAELKADLADGIESAFGGVAEIKALDARIYATVELLEQNGIQIKNLAPILLDFPGELDGRPVLWCWLEGDRSIDWYHRLECGFAGRRPT
ncbi:hypothetical protein J2S43_000409 [Catenuloplanes nepalensis]|uniref:DUF2203 domain-containing protein n=1 Tax=Catenuloplanes nepalensis TaxID=587533 RepID=A0ABT9MKG2_9ACTN|nr:DUF2203 domain-containing protein [Catenuloplanes nepalensis]MDP9791897.1 hypothetical protein [Catenuloplanes nepalensis]